MNQKEWRDEMIQINESWDSFCVKYTNSELINQSSVWGKFN